MRVISQDGNIDVPYEQISIEVRDNEIWCGYNATLGKDCIAKRFAIYSTEEKAEKSMQKLHEAYAPEPLFIHKDVSPDKRATAGEISWAQALDEMHTRMFVRPIPDSSIEQVYTGNVVFRFPQEDEI